MDDSAPLTGAAEGVVAKFLTEARRQPAVSSRQAADRTLRLLRQLVADDSWQQTSQLVATLRGVCRRLSAELPAEPVVRTLPCRLLRMVREEHEAKRRGQLSQVDSLHGRLTASGDAAAAAGARLDGLSPPEVAALRADLLSALDELQTEVDGSAENIAREAVSHIHADDVVLTAGGSRTVLQFLRTAARRRAFHVIVVEGAPFCRGQQAARELAAISRHVQVTVIAESAVFAMMARVNKVLLGAQTVLADGGLRAAVGTHSLALAAKFHSVPVIVCAPSYKLCPQFHRGEQQEGFYRDASPASVLPYSSGEVVGRARVACPVFDYVPPELVTLFVMHAGGTSPWYVYRLLNEYYDQQDHELVEV